MGLIAQIVTAAYISFERAGGPTQNGSHVKGNLSQRSPDSRRLEKATYGEPQSPLCVAVLGQLCVLHDLCNADAERQHCNGGGGRKKSTEDDGGVGGVTGSAVEIL